MALKIGKCDGCAKYPRKLARVTTGGGRKVGLCYTCFQKEMAQRRRVNKEYKMGLKTWKWPKR